MLSNSINNHLFLVLQSAFQGRWNCFFKQQEHNFTYYVLFCPRIVHFSNRSCCSVINLIVFANAQEKVFVFSIIQTKQESSGTHSWSYLQTTGMQLQDKLTNKSSLAPSQTCPKPL